MLRTLREVVGHAAELSPRHWSSQSTYSDSPGLWVGLEGSLSVYHEWLQWHLRNYRLHRNQHLPLFLSERSGRRGKGGPKSLAVSRRNSHQNQGKRLDHICLPPGQHTAFSVWRPPSAGRDQSMQASASVDTGLAEGPGGVHVSGLPGGQGLPWCCLGNC